MFLIHGTLPEAIIPILKSKRLAHQGKHPRTSVQEPSSDQIFSQIIYKGIPYQKDQVPFHFIVCFVFDISILKDFPFYATSTGGFAPTFKEGMSREGNLAIGRGSYRRLPPLRTLKEAINTTLKERPFLKKLAFIHSHEILIGKDVPLKKYCRALVIWKTHITPEIQDLASRLGIRIIEYNGERGLDSFVQALM